MIVVVEGKENKNGLAQLNGIDGVWITATDVIDVMHGDIIFARLFDGIKGGSMATYNVRDSIEPTIIFEPNENNEWRKSQNVTIAVKDAETGVGEVLKYLWKQSAVQPSESEFVNTFTNNTQITKSDGTGDNWYLWVLGTDIAGNKAIKKSNAFYLDNTGTVINSVTTSNITANSAILNVAIVTDAPIF